MRWINALKLGFAIYFAISLITFFLFVQLGLGYSFPDVANRISEIIEFSPGSDKKHSLLVSALFWTLTLTISIKTIAYFILQLKRRVKH